MVAADALFQLSAVRLVTHFLLRKIFGFEKKEELLESPREDALEANSCRVDRRRLTREMTESKALNLTRRFERVSPDGGVS